MEIVKSFESDLNVTIKGTYEKPLFRASDIGAVLEIVNTRSMTKDFDNTEKVVVSIDTPGGSQEVTFLTEKGLYQILFTSRKPIAKKFKNWVCEVIEEIRLNGKYELEKQLESKNKELINSKENTLLEISKNSRGVYLGFVDNKKQEVKFGHGIIEDRIKIHKKEIGDEFSLQYVIETIYDRELEKLIKTKLKHRVISKKFDNRKAKCVELIKIDSSYTIENLYNDILKLKKTLKDELIKSQQLTIKNLKQKLKEFENIEDSDKDSEIEIKSIESPPNVPKKKMPLALTKKFCISGINGEPSLVAEFISINEAAKNAKSPLLLLQEEYTWVQI